jgi:hypothetical protein
MADYRLGILQTDIGIVFGCMGPLVKDHPCVAAVLARISLRPDCCKNRDYAQNPSMREMACLRQLSERTGGWQGGDGSDLHYWSQHGGQCVNCRKPGLGELRFLLRTTLWPVSVSA